MRSAAYGRSWSNNGTTTRASRYVSRSRSPACLITNILRPILGVNGYRGSSDLVYERLGDTRSAAVTWGKIADIAETRGDLDEALRIRREVQLPVYERLGDTRSAALTWGGIADIAATRGELDEAADLQLRRLAVNKQLGNLEGIAAVNFSLAKIDLQRQDYHSAHDRVMDSGATDGPGRCVRCPGRLTPDRNTKFTD